MLSELPRMIWICCQLIFDRSYVRTLYSTYNHANFFLSKFAFLRTHLICCCFSSFFAHFILKLTISCVPNDVNEYFFLSFPVSLLFSFVDLTFFSLVCLLSAIGLSIDTVAFIQRKYFVSINCPSHHHVYKRISVHSLI